MQDPRRQFADHQANQLPQLASKAYAAIEHFPYKLRLARKAAGFTQEQLSGKLGLSRQVISGYERGLKKLDRKRLRDTDSALN